MLRGHAAPWVVGLVRGLVEAAVLAALGGLVVWLSSADVPQEVAAWAPALVVLIRTLEGVADQIDPSRDRSQGEDV